MPNASDPLFLAAPVVAAVVAAVASLIVSVVNFVSSRSNQRDIEGLKADLADRNAQRNARLAYEFDARKRLYQECGPLLFELSELAERALGRIIGLARTAAEGHLDAGRSWLARGYYARSTYYRLLAPLALGKLLSGKLTHLDLSLDPSIHWHYVLCRQLPDTFTDDFDFAAFEPTLPYQPHGVGAAQRRQESPEEYCQQGIPRGILDNAVSALITNDTEGRPRLLNFAEFEARLSGQTTDVVVTSFERIGYLFENFHPKTRPVLWRLLLAQAHIYRALLVSRDRSPATSFWQNLWEKERPSFDWRSGERDATVPESDVRRALDIGAEYASSRTSRQLRQIESRAVQPTT
jgi:hypothetical protein